jgi:hypothetical protein
MKPIKCRLLQIVAIEPELQTKTKVTNYNSMERISIFQKYLKGKKLKIGKTIRETTMQ